MRTPEEKRARTRAWDKAYRLANIEKFRQREREKDARRRAKAPQKLPIDTVATIGKAQGWKCGVCRCSIKHRYHVDHIIPLVRGGGHEPRNIQLLCPPCNQRKSGKDPMVFMREMGRLM